MKKKKFFKNNSGYLGLLVGIVLFVLVMMSLSAILYNQNTEEMEKWGFTVPEDYQDMTWEERYKYLDSIHGGPSKFEVRVEWAWPPLQHYRVWPDGFEMEISRLEKYLDGDVVDTNPVGFIWALITLDIPLINNLGTVIATAVKIFIYLSVAIVVYLLLPFTG